MVVAIGEINPYRANQEYHNQIKYAEKLVWKQYQHKLSCD